MSITERGSLECSSGPSDFEAAPKIVQRRREDSLGAIGPQPCPEAAGTATGNEWASPSQPQGSEAWYVLMRGTVSVTPSLAAIIHLESLDTSLSACPEVPGPLQTPAQKSHLYPHSQRCSGILTRPGVLAAHRQEWRFAWIIPRGPCVVTADLPLQTH